jgi:SAM-dependent methyltransferase
MSPVWQLARLNARVAGLALRGRWLEPGDVAAGYDRAASTYEAVWLAHLRRTTDALLCQLPSGLTGTILDLGGGTGYAAQHLAAANVNSTVVAVDVSPEMLNRARTRAPANLRCVVSDMLAYVRAQADGSARLIVSTWALGYSQPARLFRECHRLLTPGGMLVFIVNYADTLAPVFRAFRRCMLQFPHRVRLAARPRFPRDWPWLRRALLQSRFDVAWHQDGRLEIGPPAGGLLPWLRQTGILAGFDAMLDLSAPADAFFEAEIARDRRPLVHHFAMVVARKT